MKSQTPIHLNLEPDALDMRKAGFRNLPNRRDCLMLASCGRHCLGTAPSYHRTCSKKQGTQSVSPPSPHTSSRSSPERAVYINHKDRAKCTKKAVPENDQATIPQVILESKTGHDGPPAMSPLFSSLRRDSLGISFLPAIYSGDFTMRAFMQDDLLSG